MWYLHSHFEWLKLSYSSIQILLDVCLAAHSEKFLDGLPEDELTTGNAIQRTVWLHRKAYLQRSRKLHPEMVIEPGIE
jgi:hypothetical protein